MNSSSIHIVTVFLPLIILLPGIILFIISKNYKRPGYKKAGLVFFILNALTSTLTSAFGGASIKLIKSLPGIHQDFLRLHAWTAMAAFLLSLVLGGLSLAAFKNNDGIRKDNNILGLAFIFLAFYFLTVILAYKIR